MRLLSAVQESLRIARAALAGAIETVLRSRYGAKWWQEGIAAPLQRDYNERNVNQTAETDGTADDLDLQLALKIINVYDRELFFNYYGWGTRERALISAMIDVRNCYEGHVTPNREREMTVENTVEILDGIYAFCSLFNKQYAKRIMMIIKRVEASGSTLLFPAAEEKGEEQSEKSADRATEEPSEEKAKEPTKRSFAAEKKAGAQSEEKAKTPARRSLTATEEKPEEPIGEKTEEETKAPARRSLIAFAPEPPPPPRTEYERPIPEEAFADAEPEETEEIEEETPAAVFERTSPKETRAATTAVFERQPAPAEEPAPAPRKPVYRPSSLRERAYDDPLPPEESETPVFERSYATGRERHDFDDYTNRAADGASEVRPVKAARSHRSARLTKLNGRQQSFFDDEEKDEETDHNDEPRYLNVKRIVLIAVLSLLGAIALVLLEKLLSGFIGIIPHGYFDFLK
ncbi:MAG: hypothetical protein KIG36_00365 [Eubacteriales bacterium]|nr:hypothetical protein [Eubacteriales bacterium]